MDAIRLSDLQSAIDEYGADIATWPAPLREQATVLVANSAEARAMLAEALRVETTLKSLPRVKAPAGLADRIVAAAHATVPGKRRS